MNNILEHLGHGCTSNVIMCKRGDDIGALKVLPLKSDKTDNQLRIHKEAQIMLDCDSIFLIKVKEVYRSNVDMNLFLELMDKGSLENVCHDTYLCEESLSYIAWSILKGLEYLKDKSIIHRDIKPANIMVNSVGDVKIGDFGEAKVVKNKRSHSIVGTTAYMSPQRIKGQVYSFEADIWSLGITMLEISCKQFPYFLSESCRAKMNPLMKVFNKEHCNPAILELCESIEWENEPSLDEEYFSPDFCDFISCCLKKDCKDRWSVKDLLNNLTIKRRYREFESFHRYLLKTYPLSIIPPLPQKEGIAPICMLLKHHFNVPLVSSFCKFLNIQTSYEDELIRERKWIFQKFIDTITFIPGIFSDLELISFFSPTVKEYSTTITSFTDEKEERLITPEQREVLDLIGEIESSLSTSVKEEEENNKELEYVAKENSKLASDFNAFMLDYPELSNESEELSTMFDNISTANTSKYYLLLKYSLSSIYSLKRVILNVESHDQFLQVKSQIQQWFIRNF